MTGAPAFTDPAGAHQSAGIPVTGLTWDGYEARGEDLSTIIFHTCTLRNVRFIDCRLDQTLFIECVLEDVRIEGGTFDGAQWVECTGTVLAFSAEDAVTTGPVLAKCVFDEVTLAVRGARVTLSECTFAVLAFSGAGLVQYGLNVTGADIAEVRAERAHLEVASLLDAVLSRWRLAGARLTQCMLVGADGRGVDFSDVVFERSNLHEGDFTGARLRTLPGTLLSKTVLEDADLDDADATGVCASQARLARARLRRAQLAQATFSRSDLRGADATEAQAPRSAWVGSDVRDAVLDRLDAPWSAFRHVRFAGASVVGARLAHCDLHGSTDLAPEAITTGARGTVAWRDERERGAGLVPDASEEVTR